MFWHRFVQVSIELRKRAMGKGKATLEDQHTPFFISKLEVGGKDRQRGSVLLKDLTTALTQALVGEFLKLEAAHEIFVAAADEAGFPIELKNQGLPPNAGKDLAHELEIAAISGRFGNTRKPGEGNQDEDDRERGEEKVA